MSIDKQFDNAVRTMDMIHHVLLLWLFLCLAYFFLPAKSASVPVNLPFTTLELPNGTLRWACFVIIFAVGFVASALVSHLSGIYRALSDPGYIQAIRTYPSIVTVGSPLTREIYLFLAAVIQYLVGADALGGITGLGSHWINGLSWLYVAPMLWFSLAGARWQGKVT